MKPIKTILLGAGLLMLTACGAIETTTRNAPTPSGLNTLQSTPAPKATSYKVVDYTLRVPATLSVSEANTYYPVADIVWRGDPMGDRHLQVARMFQTSLETAMPSMKGTQDVKLTIELVRFHSLTERARYTVGGVHNMVWNMEIRDAATGVVLQPMQRVETNLPALGGAAAIAADTRGNTQKRRVLEHLTQHFARDFGAIPQRTLAETVEISRR
ncbi:DUF6778 family protein [Algirhabdus cladophorae]|uniref:DUF6778 family protein n=1 Tax=Algirhabdus cladophorae TaxID=3377108 RepID=UPI003B8488AB